MKFIREIIGEKRQMEENPLQDVIPVSSDFMPETDAQSAEAGGSVAEVTSGEESHDDFDETHEAPKPITQRADFPAVDDSTPVAQPRKMILGEEFAADDVDINDMLDKIDAAPEADLATPDEAPTSQNNDLAQSLQSVFEKMEAASQASQFAAEEPSEAPDTTETTEDTATDDSLDAEPQPVEPLNPMLAAEATRNEPEAPAAAAQSVEVPQPALGRGASRHGRVKTRLLGFNTSMGADLDPIQDNKEAEAAAYTKFPVGWLIVVEGEGRGAAFSLFNGVSNIGRGTDQTVCLDFGDNSISRVAHASVAYDEKQQSFYIGHCGKSNIVRRNDRPVLSTEELNAGDQITIGETTLRFVPLCGPDFSWDKSQSTGQAYAANA